MSICVEKEQVVCDFLNHREHGATFTLKELIDHTDSMWNAGCGPIRLNFTEEEMRGFLVLCEGKFLEKAGKDKWTIDKSKLATMLTEEEKEYHGIKNALHKLEEKTIAQRIDLFCQLGVDIQTNKYLLEHMGCEFLQ